MRREQVYIAIDEAFKDALSTAYKNLIVVGLAASHPDILSIEHAFSKAFDINLSAYEDARKVIAAHTELED
jgi:hypothetical protein